MNRRKNDLEVRKEDLIASALKGVCGTLPIVGPSIAEIIGYVIPSQRIDRITSLFKTLESKIDPEEKAKVEARMLEERSIDLMEDGFLQAARALSEERIDYIASLIKNSLTDEDLEHIAYKRLLSVLGEINDIEVFVLKFHSMRTIGEKKNLQKMHPDILAEQHVYPRVYIGAPQEEMDRYAIYENYRTNLIRLGLIKPNFWLSTSRGELPEFDEDTGMIKASGYDITPLGELLLRSIDQDEDID